MPGQVGGFRPPPLPARAAHQRTRPLTELCGGVLRSSLVAALDGVQAPVRECGDLEHAVSAARATAQPGDVVLLSPACASFDQFAGYEARGERFRELAGG